MKSTEYPNYEIIIVDCLTKGIEDFIREKFSNVQLISLDKDIGPSAMHNIGVTNADPTSEFFAFLDNDIIVDKKWLRELVNCINSDSSIGAVQSKIMLYDYPHLYNSRGNKMNYLAVGWPDGFKEPDSNHTDDKEIAFPSGACMIMRKNALLRVGCYDPDYFIYADDMDAGIRISLAGYKILYYPKSIIYHKYKFLKNPRNFYYLNRNRIYTYLKLYEKNTYFKLLPAFLLYETSVIYYALINGMLPNLLNAYLSILHNFGDIKRKRIAIKDFKVKRDLEIISKLDGKIEFSEINHHLGVKYVLNPFLEKYQKLIIERWDG